MEILANVLHGLLMLLKLLLEALIIPAAWIIARYWLADKIQKSEREEQKRWVSIWQHYAQGHPAKDVVACKDVRCSMFTPA